MRTAHLHDMWTSPDNSRLVSKQFSFRLPVHIAAKIAALENMYPQKNRTQLVADLLTAALENLELNLPINKGQPLTYEDEMLERKIADHQGYDYEPVYMMAGKRAEFRDLVNKYYAELESELGNDKPEKIYGVVWLKQSDFEK
jgi:hypothetical protein